MQFLHEFLIGGQVEKAVHYPGGRSLLLFRRAARLAISASVRFGVMGMYMMSSPPSTAPACLFCCVPVYCDACPRSCAPTLSGIPWKLT